MNLEELLSNENIINSLLALASAIGLIVVLILVNRGFKLLRTKATQLLSRYIKGIKIQNYDILTPEYLEKLAIGILKVFKYLTFLVILYLWLPLLFSIFPWTKGIAQQLVDMIIGPLKTVANSTLEYLPSLFFVIVVVFLVKRLINLLMFLALEVEKEKLKLPGFYKDWAKPTYNILRLVIWVFTLVIIFPYLPGSNSPAFQGVSIFLGVLLSLGSTSIVANAVGGLMIIYMRPFVVGDVIKINGTTGRIVAKNLLVTRICTSKNEDITIPNKTIIENPVINYSSDEVSKGVFIHTKVTIGYDVPWQKVHEVMLGAADLTTEVLKDPKPFVLQTALGDFSVEYEINAYTNDATKIPRTYSDLHQHLLDKFHAADIEILSPFYHANRDGNEITIPKPFNKPSTPGDLPI